MKKNKILKALTLGLLATSLMITPAYAKSNQGPGDYYDSYEDKSKYKVGSDIDPGLYVLINKSDSRNASVTIKDGSDKIWSESFWYNYIIDVDSGQIVSVVNAYLVEYDEAKDYIVSAEEGFFYVGDQIEPGTYDIEFVRSSDDTGFIRVWSDLVYADDSDYKSYQKTKNISRGSTAEVTLEEGYYVELKGCRLIHQS